MKLLCLIWKSPRIDWLIPIFGDVFVQIFLLKVFFLINWQRRTHLSDFVFSCVGCGLKWYFTFFKFLSFFSFSGGRVVSATGGDAGDDEGSFDLTAWNINIQAWCCWTVVYVVPPMMIICLATQTKKLAGIWTDGSKEGQEDGEKDREVDRQKQTDKQIGRQAVRQKDRQRERQTERLKEANKQTDRKTGR